jgi:ankyrin repeat protein
VDVRALSNDGWTPLHLAAEEGHSVVLKRLLDEDLNPDIVNSFGFRPLNLAVYQCRTDVVRLLIEAGANPRLIDPYGRSSLDWAFRHAETFNSMGKFCEGYTPTDVVTQRARLKVGCTC